MKIPGQLSAEINSLTPKFGVQYKFDGGNNVYATAAKGFRVGGYNPRQLSICQPQLDDLGLDDGSSSYKSDSVWSYEVGSKNQLLDRRLTINGSLFYIKWKNIQQFVNLASCNGGLIANLGEATSKGFDLQIEARPTNRLTLGASIGYTHGEFNQTTGISNVSAVTKGDRLPGAPWKVAINGEYRAPISDTLDAYLRADYQFASAEPNLLAPNNPLNGLNYVPAYYVKPETHFVSLRAGIRKDGLELSAFVNNLFDDATIIERVTMPVTIQPFQAATPRPRTFGLTVSYRYH